MTIRSTIALLTIPLFLGLALVNGALLYFQDRAEMQQALAEQALSAAVTVAEFVREMDAPVEQLREPVRAGALGSALDEVTDLDGLYLVDAVHGVLTLQASRYRWDLSSLRLPDKPHSYTSGSERRGARWVIAVAPAGEGRFVAARFSTEGIYDRMALVRRDILTVAAVLTFLAMGLAIFVARRISREVEANRRALMGRHVTGAGPCEYDLRIRETRDLADATRLMTASYDAADSRRENALERSEHLGDRPEAIANTRSALFPPTHFRFHNCEIAMHLCGSPPAGSFFAHARNRDGGTLVIGCCQAEDDVEALAAAQDARRLIEGCGDSDSVDEMLGRLASLYQFDGLKHLRWQHGACSESQLLSIADAETVESAEAWCRLSAGVAPATILAHLNIMLSPNGIFALVGPAVLTDGAQRGVDIGFDCEDGAEPADVENLLH